MLRLIWCHVYFKSSFSLLNWSFAQTRQTANVVASSTSSTFHDVAQSTLRQLQNLALQDLVLPLESTRSANESIVFDAVLSPMIPHKLDVVRCSAQG
eukprot:SAG31_NODE_2651_length_5296_cov_2.101770_3_plen_97_part_00